MKSNLPDVIRIVRVGCLLLAVAVSPRAACATLLAYDGFNYSPGNLAGNSGGGSFGFTETWSDAETEVLVASGNLDTTTFPFTPSGNRVDVADADSGGNRGARRNTSDTLSFDSSGVVFVSALLRRDIGSTSSSAIQVSLNGTGGGEEGRLAAFGLGSSSNFFADLPGGSVETAGSVTAGDTYFMVARITTTNAGDDTIDVYAFADSDAIPNTPGAATVSESQDISGSTMGSLTLVFGQNADGSIDEVRIGDTWASVTAVISGQGEVPEPGTLAFVALGSLALVIRRRRARR